MHELSSVIVSKLAVGPMSNNVYLLRCRRTGKQLLIDAAAEPERIMALIGPDGLSGVVTTHRHADHWGALADVVHDTGAPTYAGALDMDAIPVPTDHPLQHGDRISFGDVTLEALHLRGHTPGSIALLFEDPDGPPHLFTGDCLFPGGVGKTWSPEDFESLLADVESRIFHRLPDTTWVYPGHGDDTTVGNERPHLHDWRQRRW